MRNAARWLVVAVALVVVALVAGGVVVARTPVAFVARWWAAFEGLGLSFSARVLAVAHGAWESGWGTNTPARRGNNPWNLTAGPSWTGPVIASGDTTGDVNGNGVIDPGEDAAITQRFRAYATELDAASGYLAFLSTSRYAAAKAALLDGDAYRFATELRAAGYYTAPLNTYRSQLVAVVESVKRRLPAEVKAA